MADSNAALVGKWRPASSFLVKEKAKSRRVKGQGNMEGVQELLGHCLKCITLSLRICGRGALSCRILILRVPVRGRLSFIRSTSVVKTFLV